jgi:hypothetical protein
VRPGLFEALAVSWFVAAFLLADCLIRLGWPGRRSVPLRIRLAAGLPVAVVCPLLFAGPAGTLVYLGTFWITYAIVALGAARFAAWVGRDHRSVNSPSWSPGAGLVFAFSRVGLVVVTAVAASILVAAGRALPSWGLLGPASQIVEALWGVNPTETQVLQGGLVVGVVVALAAANVVVASHILGAILAVEAEASPAESPNVTVVIGMIERSVIALLAVMGDFTAAGFVAAIKAFGSGRLGRQGVTPAAAVIGTLFSFLFAFVTALSARWLLQVGGLIG